MSTRLTPRQFDLVLAGVFLVAFEVDIITTHTHRGPLALNILVAGAVAIATIWRRTAPLASASAVMALGVVMAAWLTNPTKHVAPLYLLFVPGYSVGAYEPRNRALAGLAVCVAGPWAMSAATNATASDWAFTAAMTGAAWAVGRGLRARRFLNAELAAKAERLAAERASRERLAVADERTRIARELHAVVAASVSAMVVQTEVAQHLLDEAPDRADDAMAAVEAAGRQTLAEMRRILGVLRRTDDDPGAALAPQPGVGQIAALVEQARDDGRAVTLDVDGEPGPLPASVDLGVYRILEDALASAGPGPLGVRLGFSAEAVELSVRSAVAPANWPTLAMRERVALCDGDLVTDGDGRLDVRLPRAFDEVFV